MPFDLDALDPEDPFELDAGNRPHLAKHERFSEADLLDIFYDAVYYPASPEGKADWLMVGQPPGEDPLVVPLAPSNSGDPTKARPIGLYAATGDVLADYRIDTGQVQRSRKAR